ncbi:unnamed protein product [Ectocarpus sp. 12 AP-2014]
MTKKHASKNNNGLCTSTWGSPGWFFLHCVAAGYPVDPDEYDDIRGNARGKTKRAYASFFKNTGHVLPCRFCRESYFGFIAETPIEPFLHHVKHSSNGFLSYTTKSTLSSV